MAVQTISIKARYIKKPLGYKKCSRHVILQVFYYNVNSLKINEYIIKACDKCVKEQRKLSINERKVKKATGAHKLEAHKLGRRSYGKIAGKKYMLLSIITVLSHCRKQILVTVRMITILLVNLSNTCKSNENKVLTKVLKVERPKEHAHLMNRRLRLKPSNASLSNKNDTMNKNLDILNRIMKVVTVWIDASIMTMDNIIQKEKFWQDTTGSILILERIDRQHNTNVQMAYVNCPDQSIVPLIGDKMEYPGAKQAPKRTSYSHVRYGNTNKTTENTTQCTKTATISTSSNTNENIKLQQTMTQAVKNMREQERQRRLTQTGKAITTKNITQCTEDATITIPSNTDDNIKVQQTKTQAGKNMREQEKQRRLTQTGQAMTKTSTIVVDPKKTMNIKIDKINLTMKESFIVISNVVRKDYECMDMAKKQKHLVELSKLLEEDASDHIMDLENSNFGTHEPSPGAKALGGEGNKK